ncbi:ATP-dependent Clp protease adapter ClpS [Alcaligenaceae bacterium CGII-47]|nr:ATP-dependent Clp protease adapter ClpS [Alcaligenaceae bacterium CGII-47]
MATETRSQREAAEVSLASRVAPPPMYQVVLLNDDYTPMEFVVHVLREVFHKTMPQAERIMLKVHHEGRGVCGIYTRDIAATRVDAVRQLAHVNQHPLQCVMEPISHV